MKVYIIIEYNEITYLKKIEERYAEAMVTPKLFFECMFNVLRDEFIDKIFPKENCNPTKQGNDGKV